MREQITTTVERVIAQAPEWLRRDLLSAEPAIRMRAEEALAATITAALAKASGVSPAA